MKIKDTKEPKITGTLRECVKVINKPYGYFVWGFVYGDIKQRFPDGSRIHTSQVKKLDGDLLYTRNSVYKIESWREQGTE